MYWYQRFFPPSGEQDHLHLLLCWDQELCASYTTAVQYLRKSICSSKHALFVRNRFLVVPCLMGVLQARIRSLLLDFGWSNSLPMNVLHPGSVASGSIHSKFSLPMVLEIIGTIRPFPFLVQWENGPLLANSHINCCFNGKISKLKVECLLAQSGCACDDIHSSCCFWQRWETVSYLPNNTWDCINPNISVSICSQFSKS